jgi:preprotein translocase subunit SecD
LPAAPAPMRRSALISLLLIVLLAGGWLAGTVASGGHPRLGLDLEGGVSVVLAPKQKVPGSVLDQSIEIIRSRVDALGVAEPEISRQGNTILVQLPGAKNQQRALQLVGQTAQLLFRPVLERLPAADAPGQEPVATTTRDADDPAQTVVLPEKDRAGRTIGRYRLGPAELTGRALSGANASIDETGQWFVDFTLNGKGSHDFDELAQRNYQKQVAIDLDGVVKSAPNINAQTFNGRGQITGQFTERDAKDLALVLKYGALPVQLEPQTVENVSATLGKDALRAGLIAGAVGIGLVALYMVLYYRALGLVVWLGLGITGALLYSLVSLLGTTSGLALTLASYIVYFERLKDEVRTGRTVRSSLDRAFARSYRTILAADGASLIGAALLYFLTVGSVRGFAFFLGISTLLDMVVAYAFTRPMVMLVAKNRFFVDAPWFGVARGLGVVEETA